VIERLLQVYVRERHEGERFIDTIRRVGNDPFIEFVYATPVAEDEKLLIPDYDLIKKGTPYDTPYYSPRF
jgi:sulfite reductase (NADPH) hemoprotein beta-component